MRKFPVYFVGKEIKIDHDGSESLLYYAAEKIELGPEGQIVESAYTHTPYGNYPIEMRVEVQTDGTFSIASTAGTFHGIGHYHGPKDSLTIMEFREAIATQTQEKFKGTYLFLDSGVRAIKTWFSQEAKENSRPKFVSYQEGHYISPLAFLAMAKDPDLIPDCWASFQVGKMPIQDISP